MSDGPYDYRPVRALERGIEVLIALNGRNRSKPATVAAATGIDRTTVYRLLATLARCGLVVRNASDDTYSLLPGVRQLSDGFNATDRVLRVVAPELVQMLPKTLWPSDYAIFEQGAMVIQESTHRFSAFSVHRGMIGRKRPVLRSALGRAVLAASSPSRREFILGIVAKQNGPEAADAKNPRVVAGIIEEVERRGYAYSVGGTESHISAIALPIRADDEVSGAINLVFFKSAMTINEAAERFLDHMRTTAISIESKLTHASPDY